MTKVTQEMIGAAHDVTMRHKIVLGHELLTEIYQAMNAKRSFVGLTDEDLIDLYNETKWLEPRDVMRFTESKLQDKNAGPSKQMTYDEQVMLRLCPHFGPSPARDQWIAGYKAAHGIKGDA